MSVHFRKQAGAGGSAATVAQRTVTGTTDSITSSDAGMAVRYTGAAAVAVALPDRAANLGNYFELWQEGAGTVTYSCVGADTLVGWKTALGTETSRSLVQGERVGLLAGTLYWERR